MMISNGVYKCAVCSHEKTLTLSIEQSDSTTNASTVYQPTLLIDGEEVDVQKMNVKWVVDGKTIENRPKLAHAYQSVGFRMVDCIVTTKDGFVVTASAATYTSQPKSSKDKALTVSNVTCKSITLKANRGYEYKLNDGLCKSQ